MAAWSRYDGLNYTLEADYTIDGQPCVALGADEALLTEIYDDLAEGRYPQSSGEVLLTRRAKAMLSAAVGDKITLHTPAGDFVYTVSGFGGDATAQGSLAALAEASGGRHWAVDGNPTGTPLSAWPKPKATPWPPSGSCG